MPKTIETDHVDLSLFCVDQRTKQPFYNSLPVSMIPSRAANISLHVVLEWHIYGGDEVLQFDCLDGRGFEKCLMLFWIIRGEPCICERIQTRS
jgi:hypothetical protein